MSTVGIDPGRLRHELVLEEAALSPDGVGGHAEAWSEVARLFGLVEPVDARSFFGADQRLEAANHRVTIRYRTDVKPGMRFVWRGRALGIRNVRDPDESARHLVCSVREDGQ